MTAPAPSDPIGFWANIHGALVVNLDHRPERFARLAGQWAALRVAHPPLTRLSAVAGVQLPGFGQRPWFRGRAEDRRWAGRVGCTQSHRKVMDYARAAAWETTLVLEDDADLSALDPAATAALGSALFGPDAPAWDVCYLGFSRSVGPALHLAGLPAQRGLYAIGGAYTTHAYLVRTRARDWIFDRLAPDTAAWAWHARHRIIDRWYSRHLSRSLRVLAVSPSLVTQVEGFSDIAHRAVDYDREFTGAVSHVVPNQAAFDRELHRHHHRARLRGAIDLVRAAGKRLAGF